ncbi:PREDICTED: protein YLS3-like [Tarenaya hassleriana]|uniref:protein YLS3-like n=1 Tax=Tarenaya hassleriana TaxID=28532 RepID=UPI00053C5EA2|nr:PREDICTED: protein YLS3-like [Tarenaya hassleriana]
MEALRIAAVVALLLLSWSAVKAATETPPPPSGGSQTTACIKRLIPCQPYIHAPVNPPATCCVPLKEIIDNDVTCLCSVFNNPAMLRSQNLTKSNALDLPKACGANADVSRCNSSATPPTASPETPTNPMTPPASTNGSSSTGGSTAGGSSSAAATTISFIGLNFVSALIATIFF